MSFITDIQWQGLQTFEEIETWFCLPMQEYLKMFDEQFVEPETALFEVPKMGPAENRACFFYYEMRSKLDDLSKLLHRLMDEYRQANTKGTEEPPKDLGMLEGQEYTPKQIELMKNFWRYIHRKEKSKHFESIGSLLALAANEEGGATC